MAAMALPSAPLQGCARASASQQGVLLANVRSRGHPAPTSAGLGGLFQPREPQGRRDGAKRQQLPKRSLTPPPKRKETPPSKRKETPGRTRPSKERQVQDGPAPKRKGTPGSTRPSKEKPEVQDGRGSRRAEAKRGTQRVQVQRGTQTPRSPSSSPLRLLGRDQGLVFVAALPGSLGSLLVREMVAAGFRVRLGVRNAKKAEEQLAELLALRVSGGLLGIFGSRRAVELVEVDLEAPGAAAEALGAAGRLVCAIGAPQDGALKGLAPYRSDRAATAALVQAAANAGVRQFVFVSSLGVGSVGLASFFNLFGGPGSWKAQTERLLQESGIPYTIIRAAGMEGLPDGFNETNNLRLRPAGSVSRGQVTAQQIAELVAASLENRSLVRNTVMDAVAEASAPRRPLPDLLRDLALGPPPEAGEGGAAAEPQRPAKVEAAGGAQAQADAGVEAAGGAAVGGKPEWETIPAEAAPLQAPVAALATSPCPAATASPAPAVAAASPPLGTSPAQALGTAEPGQRGQQDSSENLRSSTDFPPSPMPLSPYTMYADLKPPSSPTPLPPGPPISSPDHTFPPREPAAAATQEGLPGGEAGSPRQAVPERDVPAEAKAQAQQAAGEEPAEQKEALGKALLSTDLPPSPTPLSPYPQYEDLKPPTSPTPLAPAPPAAQAQAADPPTTAPKPAAAAAAAAAAAEANSLGPSQSGPELVSVGQEVLTVTGVREFKIWAVPTPPPPPAEQPALPPGSRPFTWPWQKGSGPGEAERGGQED